MKTRRLYLFKQLGFGALAISAVCGRLEAAKATPMNVLFIAVDDLRPELGCYGQTHIKSPNIDALAKKGVLFERAYCQFSHCAPSRASLLSGSRPGSRKTTEDLPAYFKNNGYYCEAMGKVYHGSFSSDNHDNPAAWSVPTWYPPPQFYFSEAGIAEAKKRFTQQAKKLGIPVDEWSNHVVKGYATEAPSVADEIPRDGQIAVCAVQDLQELKSRQPFFLALGFMGTHLPFIAPKKYWDLYPAEQITFPDNRYAPHGAPDFSLIPTFELGQYSDLGDIQSNEVTAKRLVHGYYACVSYVDAQIGKVFDEVDRLGLRENTVVVLWGDNGWKLGEHHAWSKFSNYENDTRVPVVISVPGMKTAGSRTVALVELVDLYPTLCELTGLPVPANLEGTSMAPLLANPGRPWKQAVFSEMTRKVTGGSGSKSDGKGYAIRTDRYRMVLWAKQENTNQQLPKNGVQPDDIVAVELYDHGKDPGENINCANNPEYADVIRDLKEKLYAGWKLAVPDKQ
ncbi:MAG: sulfatase [Kiritimatiellales bacterium]|nr:sulfatase [Kiritimatiellales bacterium]